MAGAVFRWRRWCWLLLPLLLFGLPLSLSDLLYRHAAARSPDFVFPTCRKVWAHRGHAATGGENSPQAVAEAFRRGAAGVEIDVLYDPELGDFVVSHDRPYTLFDGRPLRLESVLSAAPRHGLFWLDAKDLRKLSPWTAHQATRRLGALLERHGLTGRAFVESSQPLYLFWLRHQGVHTSYAVSPNDRKLGAPLYWLHAAFMKLAYAFAGADAVSMNAARYTPVTAATFDEAAVLLSTVNDAGLLRHLSTLPAVKVVLTDDDHYAVTACADRPRR